MEEYERNRDSDEALDRYREALEHYLKSSMEQGYARTLQMRRYADLLAEQLKRHNDYRTVCSLAKTQMDLGSVRCRVSHHRSGAVRMAASR